jgi:group II intron reverse transcriptase/maturase
MSPKVRKLQLALYRKAKAEPKYRFWSLYGDICRADVIETAMRAVAANGGGAGVDGEQITAYTASDEAWKQWRDKLQQELRTKSYKPSPVRRVWIPKLDGKLRPLGIPTVKDRVVQAAVVVVLMAIFEADFHPRSYAYRPKRNAHQALTAIKEAMLNGRQEVIDADLSGYFDSIPHDKIMELVARRVSDGTVLALIRAWLRAPIVEEDRKSGKRRILPNEQGTPQGGVVSPLLANLYLDALDKAVNDKCEQRPVMVRYADDFVILCRKGQGAKLLERLKRWLEARRLKLNESKTRLLHTQQESFKFLGFRLVMRKGLRSGKPYPHCEPHPRSCQKLRESIRRKLNHWTLHEPEDEMIKTVNRMVRGWAGYFAFGNHVAAFVAMQRYINHRTRRWLWHKHKRRGNRQERYPDEELQTKYGLWQLPTWAAWKHA